MDILLIFDEVITGWGRTGSAFGAQEFGVTPDIMTMAKATTNGVVPMGVVAVEMVFMMQLLMQRQKELSNYFMVILIQEFQLQ